MKLSVIALNISVFGVFYSSAWALENERWSVGYSQGIAEYIVANGPGNDFNISCNENAEDISSPDIMIDIIGKKPPANSSVIIILDGIQSKFSTDQYGNIITNCHYCAEVFLSMWYDLKTSKTMLVQFSDGRSSQFSMKGASKILKHAKCKIDYFNKKF